MSVYRKAIGRLLVMAALFVSAGVLARPARAFAADCCQTCEDRYDACISKCTNNTCKSSCARAEGSCIEVCPACE